MDLVYICHIRGFLGTVYNADSDPFAPEFCLTIHVKYKLFLIVKNQKFNL